MPRCLADIDNGKILGFGADLAEDHPVRCTSLFSYALLCLHLERQPLSASSFTRHVS